MRHRVPARGVPWRAVEKWQGSQSFHGKIHGFSMVFSMISNDFPMISNDFPWFSMIYWSRIYDLIQKCEGFTMFYLESWPFQSGKWWLATRYFWGVCIIFSINPTRFRHETSDNWIVAFWKLSWSKSHKIRGKKCPSHLEVIQETPGWGSPVWLRFQAGWATLFDSENLLWKRVR